MGEITELLHAAKCGDPEASRQLFALLYGDLKRMAHARLHHGGPNAELNTTALVHESFVKLANGGAVAPGDRPAFFSYVGKVMRSVVLDLFREGQSLKRGSDAKLVALTTGIAEEAVAEERLLALDDAMNALAKLSPELHTLVEMRYFAGLSIAEIAEITGRSARTIEREWEKARAVLRQLMVES
jgi:RNA polymerase sigma factor (TIGR02999 family)